MPSWRPVCAMLIGSHSADSISTSVVVSEQPVSSPPMMPASDSTPSSSAMTHIAVVERVGLAVERQQLLAVRARGALCRLPLHFRGVEHVQRPAAVDR